MNPQRWNLYIYVLNNPTALTDPDGRQDRGNGGGKVIDVFLNFKPSERNYVDNKGRRTMTPGPDWGKVQSEAKKKGYDVNVYKKAETTPKEVLSSLKNSEATIIISHGQGSLTPDGKFVSQALQLNGASITDGGVHPGYVNDRSGEFIHTGPSGPEATVNAAVTCLFMCNSADMMQSAFTFTGTNQSLVVLDGGRNGQTAVGTMENSASAFVGTYVNTNGNVGQAVGAAQRVIDRSKIDINQGDKLKTKEANR